jgi:hypothetical protein
MLKADSRRTCARSRGLRQRATPARERPRPGDELADAEWLGQIVVGAAFQTEHLVRLFAACRQQQDGNVLVDRLPANRAQHGPAIQPRQHQVEDDEIESFLAGQAERFVPVAGGCRHPAFELQMERHQIADVPLVLDHEHVSRRLTPFGCRGFPPSAWPFSSQV